jgi:osmoprotectant transport system permease protein
VTWFLANLGLVLQLALTHIAISAPPILIGFVLSVPIAWVAFRFSSSRRLLVGVSGLILTISGLLYTIPSLALFVSIPALIGTRLIDPGNLVIALSIYAVALMVRVASDGFAAVDADIRQSATAMGFSTWRRFWQVELPLAGPVLLSGLRVVSVSTVSLVTVGQLIGVTTLGYLFTNGLQRSIVAEVLTGIIATVVIAVLFDAILQIAGRLLMPWTAASATRRPRATPAIEIRAGGL